MEVGQEKQDVRLSEFEVFVTSCFPPYRSPCLACDRLEEENTIHNKFK